MIVVGATCFHVGAMSRGCTILGEVLLLCSFRATAVARRVSCDKPWSGFSKPVRVITNPALIRLKIRC